MCGSVGGRRPLRHHRSLLLYLRVMSFVHMSIAMAALLLEGYEGIYLYP